LSGNLASNSGGYALSINTTINASNASFSGAAVAVAAGTVASGSASGNFYGANAASLAGIATFANNQYNAAYGGTKN
jgi:hypothetical protein